jgi:hypothetical protein
MPGLLADVNVQGQLPYLRWLLDGQGLLELLTALDLVLATFPNLGLDRRIDDSALWNYCQENGWVLFTENRNFEDENSLEATIRDSWHEGHLPIITLGNKGRFDNSEDYAMKVAEDVADVLVSVFHDEVRDQPRIFVPR